MAGGRRGERAGRRGGTPADSARTAAPPTWWPALLLFLLAFAFYGNTLGHGYALDDGIVITSNAFTKQGLRGIPALFRHDTFYGCFQAERNLVSGGRYRPLSLATFAIEVQLAGENPHLGHAVNVALYGLTGVVLFLLLARLSESSSGAGGWLGTPFLATLLFLAHPLHTEVVANIKGRDEILALLLALASAHAALHWADRGRAGLAALALAGVSFLLAALAKESALPFVVLIPLALWFFRQLEPRRLAVVAAALAAPAAVYAVMRGIFAGPSGPPSPEILNHPFLGATLDQRLGTVCKTFGLYLKLLLLPHPLSHDYFFDQVPLARLSSPSALVPLAVAAVLAVVALRGLRERRALSFGLLFFAVGFSIVSNLLVDVGTPMAERFLYAPSLGLALAAVEALRGGLARLAGARAPRLAGAIVIGASAVFASLTVARNPAWKDNLTLFTTDVRHSPRSAKLQTAVASVLTDSAATQPDSAARRAMLDRAEAHAEEALRIYPRHSLAWILLGNLRLRIGRDPAREALACYRKAAEFQPEMGIAWRNAALAETRLGDYRAALADLRRMRSLGAPDTGAVLLEADAFEALGEPDSALAALERAARGPDADARVLGRLGRLTGRYRRDYTAAVGYLDRAAALAPDDPDVRQNLGVAQAMAGRPRDALATFRGAIARFGGSPALDANLGLVWQALGAPDSARFYFGRASAAQQAELQGMGPRARDAAAR